MVADRRFLIQNGHPTLAALDPRGALNHRAGRKNLAPFVAEPQGMIKKNHRRGIWHEGSNIVQLVALDRAFLHRCQIFRLKDDAALKDHHGVRRNEFLEFAGIALLGDPPNAALKPNDGLDNRGL